MSRNFNLEILTVLYDLCLHCHLLMFNLVTGTFQLFLIHNPKSSDKMVELQSSQEQNMILFG